VVVVDRVIRLLMHEFGFMSVCVSCCRMVYLARDYSTKRVCFGETIKGHKLHVKTLANMEVVRSATL